MLIVTFLLLIAIVIPVLAAARLTRLVTDDKLTEPLRAEVLHRLRHDRQQRAVIREHHRTLQAAIAEGHRPPAQQPILPAAQRPALARAKLWFAYLLSCRWCAAVWVAVPVCLGCRHITTYDIPTLWRAVPWQEADWFTFPLWTLGIAYAVGWLGAKED